MSKRTTLSRRTVLRGLGTAIALPWLESLTAARGLAGTIAHEAIEASPPTRLAFFFVPNGVHVQDWKPATEGSGYELPWILEPLAHLREEFSLLTGLTHDKARANGDGPGDHARASAAYLTASQPYKTNGANLRSGVSVDQVAATSIGSATRFASLELGIEKGMNAGNCDSGYSCAYSSNISWRSESTPMAKEVNPRLVFDRLFAGPATGEAAKARALREQREKSILDFVMADAGRLHSRLGNSDRRKLDEYMTSVRELEQRLGRTDLSPADDRPELARPNKAPAEYADHVALMLDLLVLAFQTDLTRVATFMFANAGSNRSYRNIDISDGHHDLSHHGKNEEKQEKIRRINQFHVSLLARFLDRLKQIPEGRGSLLDHSMIIYGSGISDGNRHNHDDLPVLLAGRGSGTLSTGRHIVYPNETPMANLFLSLLDRVGVHLDRFGDSTGRLSGLT